MDKFPTQENNTKGKQIKTWQIQQKKMNKYDKNNSTQMGISNICKLKSINEHTLILRITEKHASFSMSTTKTSPSKDKQAQMIRMSNAINAASQLFELKGQILSTHPNQF